jgi:hypothetical protein
MLSISAHGTVGWKGKRAGEEGTDLFFSLYNILDMVSELEEF